MNRVADTILREAEAKALEIKNNCKKEIKLLQENHEKELKSIQETQNRELEKIYSSQLNREKTKIDINNNKKFLYEKHKHINNILKETRDEIMQNRELYKDLMKTMIKNGISSGREIIIISSEDNDLFENEIKPYIQNELGHKDVSLTQESDVTFRGFYLYDGLMEYNGTIDVILKDIYEELDTDIVNLLFY